jgi:hypothetical protein
VTRTIYLNATNGRVETAIDDLHGTVGLQCIDRSNLLQSFFEAVIEACHLVPAAHVPGHVEILDGLDTFRRVRARASGQQYDQGSSSQC